MNSSGNKNEYDLAVIGGGPGGMAVAVRAKELGIDRVIIIERDRILGGVLPQCIHSGFGLKIFDQELTGPEYAQLYIDKVKNLKVKVLLDTIALKIDQEKNIVCASRYDGIRSIKARAIVLALGSRERTRGAICIPGTRPSGIFTAGFVQKMVNIYGYLPGSEIVILGSGDIGLIMARRLYLEGCKVKGVYELMPFSSGLRRNILQCLEDYDIPLYLSHTVTNIYGNKRVEEVEVSRVDNNCNIISSSKKRITCDTLILSVGLIPENELSKTVNIELDESSGGPIVKENLETSVDGIFTCGNSLYINDIVDDVTEDGYMAAESVLQYLDNKKDDQKFLNVLPGKDIAYIVPQKINGKGDVGLRVRAKRPFRDVFIKSPELDFRKKVKFVSPGELLSIRLRKKDIASYKGDVVKFHIERVERN